MLMTGLDALSASARRMQRDTISPEPTSVTSYPAQEGALPDFEYEIGRRHVRRPPMFRRRTNEPGRDVPRPQAAPGAALSVRRPTTVMCGSDRMIAMSWDLVSRASVRTRESGERPQTLTLVRAYATCVLI
jgi:hypothetical protein